MKILNHLLHFCLNKKILKRSQKIRITTGHAPLSCHRNESADANNNNKKIGSDEPRTPDTHLTSSSPDKLF